MRTGAQSVVACLGQLGVDRIFGVPGESFLGVLDALVDAPGIEFVTTRHESGAGFMAVADSKLTGRPGVAFVTRGPGAMNASIALHVAQQDSLPMVLFVGQIEAGMRGREAFQEMDYRAVFGSVAKWVTEIDDAARVPEMLSRAFATAMAGRPGPVVLALPEDMQAQEVAEPVVLAPIATPAIAAADALVSEAVELLSNAKRPLIIVGGGRWSTEASIMLREMTERLGLPVAAEFRCQDFIDNLAPTYIGDMGLGMAPYLQKAVGDSDVILALGARLGEVPTVGYKLLDVPRPAQSLIHVLPEPSEIGRVYTPKVGIVADGPTFLSQLVQQLKHVVAPRERVRELHQQSCEARDFPTAPGPVDVATIVRELDVRFRDQAIVTNGAGNYSVWVHKLCTYASYPSQLAPVSGAMGYGVPAAIAAALRRPDRPVFCFAGDGCFLMTGQELATAVRHKLRIVFFVVNNGMYGTIRMHQERHFPGRISATDLTNPDFAEYARSFGAGGAVVTRTEQAMAALDEALGREGPTVIELRVDPEALTPRQTLSEVRGS